MAYIGWISILLGLGIVFLACYLLFYRLDKDYEKRKIAHSQAGLKVISWLAASGMIMVFLGILFLMGIIPWWH
jgi:ABC-type antimicrobial peptide transport system permease subunit